MLAKEFTCDTPSHRPNTPSERGSASAGEPSTASTSRTFSILIGLAALVVFLQGLLILESYLGGLIRDQSKDVLTVVHVPLAIGLMALAAVPVPLAAPVAGSRAGLDTDRSASRRPTAC